MGPPIPPGRIAVSLPLAAVELGGEGRWNGRGSSGVETLPQAAHQLNPLLGGQGIDGNCVFRSIPFTRFGRSRSGVSLEAVQ